MRHFFRLSGGGNDFLGFVSSASEPGPEEIQAVCRRGLSEGADGIFILDNNSSTIGMRYFNADGRPADLCLNGTRCAVRLARHLGWGADSLEIETGAGTFRGHLEGDHSVALDLPKPETPRQRTVEHDGSSYTGWHLTIGVPHFVLPWPASLAAAPVDRLGAPLRLHGSWGRPGANIDFVRFVDPNRLEIRTFERGVEAETLACGTGVMAAVAAGLEAEELELPVTALTLGGFELQVAIAADVEDSEVWSLTGDARLVAEGTLHPGALELPDPPVWS